MVSTGVHDISVASRLQATSARDDAHVTSRSPLEMELSV
jgi:hypothetical protein